jgi:hypothetical protein
MTVIWKALSEAYSLFSAERCAHVLARYLVYQPWTQTRQQAQAVTELADRLRGFDPHDVLMSAVASALGATPSASQWDFAQDWLVGKMLKDVAAAADLRLAVPLKGKDLGHEWTEPERGSA